MEFFNRVKVTVSRIILLSFLVVLFVIPISFVLYYPDINTTGYTTKYDNNISNRIDKISQNLSYCSSELSKIQEELEERIEFVEKLDAQYQTAENLISLSSEQLEAIQTKINQEFESNNTQSIIQSILINSLFFILGSILLPAINLLLKKRKEVTKINTQPQNYSENIMKEILHRLENIEKNNQINPNNSYNEEYFDDEFYDEDYNNNISSTSNNKYTTRMRPQRPQPRQPMRRRANPIRQPTDSKTEETNFNNIK